MSQQHPIGDLMDTSMQNLHSLVDVNTVVGDPIVVDRCTVIPISKVSFGFASGGSDFPSKKENSDLFGGGSGGGVTIQPLGFLVIQDGEVKWLQMQSSDSTADRAVSMIPGVIDQVSALFSKNKKTKSEKIESEAPEV